VSDQEIMTAEKLLWAAHRHLTFPQTVPSTAHVYLLRQAMQVVTEQRIELKQLRRKLAAANRRKS